MDLQPIIAKIVADTKQFDKPMQHTIGVMQRFNKKSEVIGSTVRVTAKEMNKAGKATDTFRLAMTRLSRDIKVAGTILNTLQAGITRAYDAAAEGAKIMAAQAFFENAGKSIQKYREATRGMVSDAELMKKANLADSMGIDEKTFKQLVLVAEAAALKTGQSFDYMFNSIITGTARSSRLLLDNLGIIVSVKQANEEWARGNNKVVEAMTATEKQLAFIDEVGRKSTDTIDEYNQVTDKTAETFARFDANVQNLADSLKIKLAQAFALVLPALNSILSDMNSLIANQDWSALGEYVALKFLQGFTGGIGKFESFMPLGLIGQALGVDLTVMGNVADEIGEYAQGIRDRSDAKAGAAEQSARWLADERREELVLMFGDEWKQKVEDFVSTGTTGMSIVFDSMVKGFLEANRAAGNFFGLFKKKMEEGPNGSKPDKKPKSVRRDPLDGMFNLFNIKSLQKASTDKAMEEHNTRLRETAEALFELDRQIRETTDAVKMQEIDALERRNQERREAVVSARDGAISGAVGGLASGGGLFGPIAAAVGPVIGTMVGGPLGTAIGALLPVLGGLLDKLAPVIDLVADISEGLGVLIENALGQLLSLLYPLGDSLKVLLAAVGQLVGAAVRPLVTILVAAVTGVSMFISLISAAVVFLTPFIEMLAGVLSVVLTSGLSLIGLFFNVDDAISGMTKAADDFAYGIIEAVANINNAIVKWARGSLGLKGFGELMFASQFGLLDDDEDAATEDNTDAVEANTQALRDFAREFRNLPQNYKVAGAIQAAADPEVARRRLPGSTRGITEQIGVSAPRSFANVRDRL